MSAYSTQCTKCGAEILASNVQLHVCEDTKIDLTRVDMAKFLRKNDADAPAMPPNWLETAEARSRTASADERQYYERALDQLNFNRVSHAFHDASRALDTLIMSTPTSPKREHLTEANIHLQSAIEALGKAMRA